MRALAPGQTIHNRYQILALAGRGGMGAVYAARDDRLGLTVALKQTLSSDEVLRRAFRREARLLASLRHPCLPRVLDHFEDAGELFLVMEYVPGDDLGALLARRKTPFDAAQVLAWGDQLLGTLEYLHDQSPPVVHRDIKPQNLKLRLNNEVVLLDFGLARGVVGGQTQMLSGATLAGYTPHYAPIEQIQGGKTDARADLYGFGATMYHLLTGKPPADALARAIARLNDDPDPMAHPSDACHTLPRPVGDAIMAVLTLRAVERPASAAALRAILRSAAEAILIVEGLGVPPSATSPYAPRGRRAVWLVAPVITLALAAGLGVLGTAQPASGAITEVQTAGVLNSITATIWSTAFPTITATALTATVVSTRAARRPTADRAATSRVDEPPTVAPATATAAPSPTLALTATSMPAPRRPTARPRPAATAAPTDAPAPIPVIPGSP